MTWNKDNPRFKRPAMSGGGRKKNKGLVGRFKDSLDGLLNKKDEPQRLQPPPPADLIDDLKLAVPKPKKNPAEPEKPEADAASAPLKDGGPVAKAPWPRSERQPKSENRLGEPGSHEMSFSRSEASPLHPEPQRANVSSKTNGDSLPRRGNAPSQFSGGLNASAGNELDSPLATKASAKNSLSDQGETRGLFGGKRRPIRPASEPLRGNASPQFSGGLNGSAGNGLDGPLKEQGQTRLYGGAPSSGESKTGRPVPPSSAIDEGLGCDPIIDDDETNDVCRPPRRKIRPVKARRGEDSSRAKDGSAASAEKKLDGPFAADRKPPRPPADERPAKNEDSALKSENGKSTEAPAEAIGDACRKPAENREAAEAAANAADRKSKNRRASKISRPLIIALAGVGLVAAITFGARQVFFSEPSRPTAKVARIPQANLPKVPPMEPGFFELYSGQRADAPQTSVIIEPGGSLGKALEALGIGSKQGAGALTRYMTNDGIAPVVLPGDEIRAFWTDKSKTQLGRLEYIPTAQNMKAEATPLVIMRGADGNFWHYRPSPPLLTLSAAREATIESSLWAAGSKAGLDAGIIVNITEILASDIDFMTNIQRGDNFQVLYSREYRDGRPKGQPIIDMIKLTNRGRTYEYYRFVNQGDQVGYYDPNGRSAQKSFFMTPLQYKRISSQFTLTRLHPIHKVVRPHQGVDYAAPSGTPVSSVSDGTVVFCGWNGGYGKLVTIKHDETYTTMYAHLSKFAPGLQKGSIVKQGDLIGFVGATGTATGPHLDFRMKRNGTFIDPLPELAKQEGKRLDADSAQAFATVVGNIQQRYRQTLDLPANRNAP